VSVAELMQKADASGQGEVERSKKQGTNHLVDGCTKSGSDRSSSFRGRDRDRLVKVERDDGLCEEEEKE